MIKRVMVQPLTPRLVSRDAAMVSSTAPGSESASQETRYGTTEMTVATTKMGVAVLSTAGENTQDGMIMWVGLHCILNVTM